VCGLLTLGTRWPMALSPLHSSPLKGTSDGDGFRAPQGCLLVSRAMWPFQHTLSSRAQDFTEPRAHFGQEREDGHPASSVSPRAGETHVFGFLYHMTDLRVQVPTVRDWPGFGEWASPSPEFKLCVPADLRSPLCCV
jgi:hypothetical protein